MQAGAATCCPARSQLQVSQAWRHAVQRVFLRRRLRAQAPVWGPPHSQPLCRCRQAVWRLSHQLNSQVLAASPGRGRQWRLPLQQAWRLLAPQQHWQPSRRCSCQCQRPQKVSRACHQQASAASWLAALSAASRGCPPAQSRTLGWTSRAAPATWRRCPVPCQGEQPCWQVVAAADAPIACFRQPFQR